MLHKTLADVPVYLEAIDLKTKFMFQLYRDLNRKSNQVRNCRAKIELLGSYDPQKQFIIEDPYYVSTAYRLPSCGSGQG